MFSDFGVGVGANEKAIAECRIGDKSKNSEQKGEQKAIQR